MVEWLLKFLSNSVSQEPCVSLLNIGPGWGQEGNSHFALRDDFSAFSFTHWHPNIPTLAAADWSVSVAQETTALWLNFITSWFRDSLKSESKIRYGDYRECCLGSEVMAFSYSRSSDWSPLLHMFCPLISNLCWRLNLLPTVACGDWLEVCGMDECTHTQ